MARSARMLGGEWRQTAQSGKTMYTTAHWGPGQHSMRSMTHGFGAGGEPWRDLGVAYWHPARKQLCTLALTAFKRGVSEGVIRVDGDSSEAALDLYQMGDHRRLVARTVFDGPDKVRSSLSEVIGPGRLAPLGEWESVRSWTLTPVSPLTAEEAGQPAKELQPLERLWGHGWETMTDATGDWATKGALPLRSIAEWIPLADGVYARVQARSAGGEPTHVLDVYVYHHTGTGTVRCLALSNQGAVHEGDVTVLEGGALQVDLKSYQGDGQAAHVARFDFEKDGTLRSRVWSLDGGHKLRLDVHHKKLAP